MLNTMITKSLMHDRKMKQRELAEKLGVSEVTVSRYFSGKRKPSEVMVDRIAKALGVASPEIQLGEEDGYDPESALREVKYLVRRYSQEWSHNDRVDIVDRLMW